MAETVTGEQILAAVIQRGNLGVYLANAEITSIAAGSVTSVFHLRNAQLGLDEYRNRLASLYRPANATGMADNVRWAGSLTTSSGALATDANWADSTLGTENIYVMYDRAEGFNRSFTPRQFLDALNEAARDIFVDSTGVLSMRANGTTQGDADFQLSATSSWTESDVDGGAATTFSKVSTANSENVYPGRINSGRVLNGAANGYIRQRYSVSEDEQLIAWSLTRLDAGTAVELRLYDVSNSAEIESDNAVEHDQEAWQFMKRVESAPSGCKIIEVRHQGEGASDDFYIAGSWVYKRRGSYIVLDTVWETTLRMPKLARYEMRNSTASNVWDAFSARLVEIPEGDDTYHFDIQTEGANPYGIMIHDSSLFDYPLVIMGRRPLSDFTTFTLGLSETTSGKLDLIEAKTRERLFRADGPLPDPARLQAAQDAVREQETQPRKQTPQRRIPDYYMPGLRS